MNKVINLLLVKYAPVLLVKGIIMTHNNRDVCQSDIETIIELVGQCFWNISNKIGTKEKKFKERTSWMWQMIIELKQLLIICFSRKWTITWCSLRSSFDFT